MPIPAEVAALWSVFVALSATRRAGLGASPLCLADLEAWSRLTRTPLTPWELDTLIAIDAAALAASHPRSA